MVYYALRSCLLFLSGYYVFIKITKKTGLVRPTHEHLVVLGITLASSVMLAYTKEAFLSIYILSLQFISVVTFKILYRMRWSTAYITTTIAHGIVHGLLFISTFLQTAILYFCMPQKPDTAWATAVLKLIPVILNMLFLYLLLRIRRLRSGLPFLQELRIFDISVIISNFVLMLSTIVCATTTNTPTVIYTFFATIFVFVSYLLWKRRIRAKYIRALRQQEIAATQEAIREQTEKLRILTEENHKLSEIIHRDNKLIPAMELSVRTYLQADDPDPALGSQLLEQLSVLTAERKGILTQYEQDGETIRHTGCASIDIVLDYMHQKAKQENVRFRTDCSEFQAAWKRQKIDETDVKTILADLIENAIIACRSTAHKQVFVYIGTIRNRFIIRVFDSGIPFEIETLHKIGLERTTTHADENGSGIGMQTLFTLKNKYDSSILIQEHNPEHGLYTKSIAVIFDRFNHFIVRSYRAGQLRSECQRSDLIVEAEDGTRPQSLSPISVAQS